MKKALSLAFLVAAITAWSQSDKPAEHFTVASQLDRQVSVVEHDFVPAAEAMPEDKFDFAPSAGEFKGVRTFGQQVTHVAVSNYDIAAAILGEKPPVDIEGPNENGPVSLKTKAEKVKYLKDSFTYAHKAVASINEQNMLTPVANPFNPKTKTTRLALAGVFAWHSFDHYGQVAEYLRMNNIIPPASRQP